MPTTEQVQQWLIALSMGLLMFGPVPRVGGNHIARNSEEFQRQLEVQRQQQLDAHPNSLPPLHTPLHTAPQLHTASLPVPTANCPMTPWRAVCLEENQEVQAGATTPDHAPGHDGEPTTSQSGPVHYSICDLLIFSRRHFLETDDEVKVIKPLWDGPPELFSTKGVDRGVRGTIIRTEKNRDGQRSGVWVNFRGIRDGKEMVTPETIFAQMGPVLPNPVHRMSWMFQDDYMDKVEVFVPSEDIGSHLEKL